MKISSREPGSRREGSGSAASEVFFFQVQHQTEKIHCARFKRPQAGDYLPQFIISVVSAQFKPTLQSTPLDHTCNDLLFMASQVQRCQIRIPKQSPGQTECSGVDDGCGIHRSESRRLFSKLNGEYLVGYTKFDQRSPYTGGCQSLGSLACGFTPREPAGMGWSSGLSSGRLSGRCLILKSLYWIFIAGPT